tara:strand:- start:175 stop:345 length:171 start_codon:yes stop_codon:yes gene_type:complete
LLEIYPNFPEVNAMTNAQKVTKYPTVKWVKPTNCAWTIDNATGLSLQPTKLAIGVL